MAARFLWLALFATSSFAADVIFADESSTLLVDSQTAIDSANAEGTPESTALSVT